MKRPPKPHTVWIKDMQAVVKDDKVIQYRLKAKIFFVVNGDRKNDFRCSVCKGVPSDYIAQSASVQAVTTDADFPQACAFAHPATRPCRATGANDLASQF